MNKAFLSLQAAEDPRQVYVDANRTNVIVNVTAPPAGKGKVATPLTLFIYTKAEQDRVMQTIKEGSYLFVAGAKLRHDLKKREHSLHGGLIYPVNPGEFGIINDVILGGRCIKDVDRTDERAYRVTDGGYVISNQTISVNTGKQQADLYNFYAINEASARYNLAELVATMTKKGTGLTISGRLVTDGWTDKASNEQRYSTKIQLVNMTLAPKAESGEIKPSTELAPGSTPSSLWGNADDPAPAPQPVAAAPVPAPDVWSDGLPDLPSSNDDNDPF
jgi:single-stranded DNA-binding protein